MSVQQTEYQYLHTFPSDIRLCALCFDIVKWFIYETFLQK